MRIAIANWDDRVSPVLDTAASLTVIEQGVAGESGRRILRLEGTGVSSRAREIGALGLDALICGAISRPLHEVLSAGGFEIVAFVAGGVDQVLAAFLRGDLPNRALTLPGCRCHRHGWECPGQPLGRGRGHGHGGASGAARAGPLAASMALGVGSGEAEQAEQGGCAMVVVSARGESVDAAVDSRFGRAAYFVAVEVDSGVARAYSNKPNLELAQGAGIQAAEAVARLEPEALISGNVGPKAFRVLQAAGIRVYRCEQGTVAEAVARFRAGALQELSGATVEGHTI